MSLDTDLLELINDAKSLPEANYVMWAKVGQEDHIIGETTLGPTADAALMKAALLSQFTTRLGNVPYTAAQIANAEPILILKFDAVVEVEDAFLKQNIAEGELCLVEESAWLMLQAQGRQPTKINGADTEILLKGRSVRLGIAQ
jgi:hypothetical protein